MLLKLMMLQKCSCPRFSRSLFIWINIIYVQRLILGKTSIYLNVCRIDEGICIWQILSFLDIKGKTEAIYNDK